VVDLQLAEVKVREQEVKVTEEGVISKLITIDTTLSKLQINILETLTTVSDIFCCKHDFIY